MGQQRAALAQEPEARRWLSQSDADRLGLQRPDFRNDLLNLARGVDPTFGFLSGKLPEPEREDPMLQLMAGLFGPGLPEKAMGGIARLLGSALTRGAGGLARWGDEAEVAGGHIGKALAEIGIFPANRADQQEILGMLPMDTWRAILDRSSEIGNVRREALDGLIARMRAGEIPPDSRILTEAMDNAEVSTRSSFLERLTSGGPKNSFAQVGDAPKPKPKVNDESESIVETLLTQIRGGPRVKPNQAPAELTEGLDPLERLDLLMRGGSSNPGVSEIPDWQSILLQRPANSGAFSTRQIEEMVRGATEAAEPSALDRLLQGMGVLGGQRTEDPLHGILAREIAGLLAGTGRAMIGEAKRRKEN